MRGQQVPRSLPAFYDRQSTAVTGAVSCHDDASQNTARPREKNDCEHFNGETLGPVLIHGF